MAELTPQAVLAVSAGQVLLDGHPISLANAPASGESVARLHDDAHVLVAQDSWRPAPPRVAADVATAHAGRLDLEQRRVGPDMRQRKFAQLGRLRSDLHGCQRVCCVESGTLRTARQARL